MRQNTKFRTRPLLNLNLMVAVEALSQIGLTGQLFILGTLGIRRIVDKRNWTVHLVARGRFPIYAR